jgi:hypothetical protein
MVSAMNSPDSSARADLWFVARIAVAMSAVAFMSACSSAVPEPTDVTAMPASTSTSTPAPIPSDALKVPASIDATGSKDVAVALQSFINGVPNGSTIVFKAGGTYRLDSRLSINGRRNLTLEGNGARLDLKGTSGRYDSIGIQVMNGSVGTTIRDFTMVGNNQDAGTSAACCSREAQHAIAITGSDDTLIEDMDIRRVWGDCVYAGVQTLGGAWSTGVTFRDSTCRLTGRHGVGIIAAERVRIVNNVFDEIGYMIVDIEPNRGDQGAIDVVVRDNTIGTYGLTRSYVAKLLGAGGPDTGAIVRDVTVTGNTVEGNPGGYDGKVLGVTIQVKGDRGPREDFTITNNVAKNPANGPVMNFRETHGVTVTGNTQPLKSGELATFSGSTDVIYEP